MNWAAAPPASMDWIHIKEWLEHVLVLNMDALHIYFGLAILLLAALILRRPLRSPLPWLVVLLLELANEYNDWTAEIWPGWLRKIQVAEGLHDIWNTMAIPTLLLIASRWFPRLFTGRVTSGPDAGEARGEPGQDGEGSEEAH